MVNFEIADDLDLKAFSNLEYKSSKLKTIWLLPSEWWNFILNKIVFEISLGTVCYGENKSEFILPFGSL